MKQSAEGAKGQCRYKNFGVLQSIFVLPQSNKNDQIVLSTLQHVTIISYRFLKLKESRIKRHLIGKNCFGKKKLLSCKLYLKWSLKTGELNVISNGIF